MLHIETAREAIENAGGARALADKIYAINGGDREKMLGRVRMWKVNGVPLPYIRIVSKLGKVAITKLVPTHNEDK